MFDAEIPKRRVRATVVREDATMVPLAVYGRFKPKGRRSARTEQAFCW
jgi:hypothetical protein